MRVGPDSFYGEVAGWSRGYFAHPSRVAATLEFIGALAVTMIIPLRHWKRPDLIVLLVCVGIAIAMAITRLLAGSRLPRASLHVDVGLSTLLISTVSFASSREAVDLSNLYLFVVVYVILYLPPLSAFIHITAAGVAYAVVLALSTGRVESPVVSWLAVFGTATVLGVVVLGLVSVLRVDAQRDPLTGLANRRMWDERLAMEMERSRRSGTALSVIMIDLDDFKEMNDVGGHDAGDRLLQELARAWLAALRGGSDFLARLGGDEFAVIAPGSDDVGIRSLTNRLNAALPQPMTISIGVATWNGTESASDLLRRADHAMYQIKRRRPL